MVLLRPNSELDRASRGTWNIKIKIWLSSAIVVSYPQMFIKANIICSGDFIDICLYHIRNFVVVRIL
ncbi:hypothetical protein BDQ17DRAFT_1355410 [Cyathus striatus]|nr:hypothetical protein BDQ17DRAFT_1355410 [Cyathus striatus]